MMRLSILWKIDSTIDADGSSPLAQQIGERWTHDRGSLRFFRSSSNFLYLFQNGGQHYFLRFVDGAERSRAAIEAELDLLGRLSDAGIDVAVPVPSRGGQLVETVASEWGSFHAVVFPALAGEQHAIEALDVAGFRRWGAALGSLHAALQRYPDTGSPARPSWQDQLDRARQYLPADAPALRDELEDLASTLAALPRSRENYGLIHGDFELDNLLFRDDAVAILDFDDCVQLWYAADIAFALGDLFDMGAGLDDAQCKAFIAGYTEHRAVDAELPALVPLFRRLDGLLSYVQLAKSADLAVGPEHPEWLLTLSRKLQQRMAAYSNGFGKPKNTTKNTKDTKNL